MLLLLTEDCLPAEVVAATPSESEPSEGPHQASQDIRGTNPAHELPVREPTNLHGSGRSNSRGASIRGSSGRPRPLKATAGRGRPQPKSGLGRGPARGRGRGKKLSATRAEATLQEHSETTGSQPPAELHQPSSKTAVKLPLKKGKRPRLADESAEEDSVLEERAPAAKPKAKKVKGKSVKKAVWQSEEQTCHPTRSTPRKPLPSPEIQLPASDSLVPDSPRAAEVERALEGHNPAEILEGDKSLIQSPMAKRRLPSKPAEQPPQVQQQGAKLPNLSTQNFVRRSNRNVSRKQNTVDPDFVLLEEFSDPDSPRVNQHVTAAKQEGCNAVGSPQEGIHGTARVLKSANDLHQQADLSLIEPLPTGVLSGDEGTAFQPEKSFSPKARGRARGRGQGRGRGRGGRVGRPRRATPARTPSEEPVEPVPPEPAFPAIALPVEPGTLPAQAEIVQPQLVAEPAVPPAAVAVQPIEPQAEQAQGAPGQATKKGPKKAAAKKGKQPIGLKRKAAQQPEEAVPHQVCRSHNV